MLALSCGGGGGGDGAASQPTPVARQDASDWCTAGSSWTTPGFAAGAQITQAMVVGMTDFKAKSYCKATYEIEAGGQKTLYTYYFNEDGTDMWAVVEAGSQVQEIHVAGGG